MSTPEEAEQRGAPGRPSAGAPAGGYAGVGGPGALDESIVHGAALAGAAGRVGRDRDRRRRGDLLDPQGGAPITFFKRILARLLRQYFMELEARQTRFNIALLERLDALEERDRAVTAVHQVLSSAGPYDAVSVQARLWRELLTGAGYGGGDHAAAVDPRARGDFEPLERLRPSGPTCW